jgi:DNA-binding response OmpR family regulator
MVFVAPAHRSHPTLLISDDDRDFRDALAESLQRRGFELLLASNGREALSLATQCSVDLLLLDMHMPQMTGLETLASLRALRIVTPCILMSAALDRQIIDRVEALETAGFLAKPFRLQTMLEAIRGLLDPPPAA